MTEEKKDEPVIVLKGRAAVLFYYAAVFFGVMGFSFIILWGSAAFGWWLGSR